MMYVTQAIFFSTIFLHTKPEPLLFIESLVGYIISFDDNTKKTILLDFMYFMIIYCI